MHSTGSGGMSEMKHTSDGEKKRLVRKETIDLFWIKVMLVRQMDIFTYFCEEFCVNLETTRGNIIQGLAWEDIDFEHKCKNA